jgi:hypothetical protein
MPASSLSHDEIVRIYGPWVQRTSADVAELFDGYPGRWWIAGGHAIEAFTGVTRPHGDVDPSVPREELPLLRRHLAGRRDVWAANQETLRVLLPEDIDAPGEDHLDPGCENVWARRSGADPWEFDIILMKLSGGRWVFKRDQRISLPYTDITWTQDGIRYLRPEIQLLHKARGLRPKDQADFDAAWPLLDDSAARWLRDSLTLTQPGHPWLDRM